MTRSPVTSEMHETLKITSTSPPTFLKFCQVGGKAKLFKLPRNMQMELKSTRFVLNPQAQPFNNCSLANKPRQLNEMFREPGDPVLTITWPPAKYQEIIGQILSGLPSNPPTLEACWTENRSRRNN